jgi:hypothetical protein
MPTFQMTNPPSVDEYRQGLHRLVSDAKAKTRYLPLLRAHYLAPLRTATLEELNKVARCQKVSAVNMLHVHIAKRMFKDSGIRPIVPNWNKGTDPRWWPFVYIYHDTGIETLNTYELRPELATALDEMNGIVNDETG